MRKIKVKALTTRQGDVLVKPVAEEYCEKYRQHMREVGGPSSAAAFFQEGMGAEEFLANDVPPRHRRDLEQGCVVTFLIDPWEFGHWLGWDAHEVEL
jgi:hypothetical protein